MNDRQCYTYHIAWSHLDRHYYGARYAKGCDPSDLWVKYKTSSRSVEEFAEIHGEPDVVEIRRLHESPEAALLWEERVLTKLNVLKNDKWLNASVAGRLFNNIYGRDRSSDCRKKISKKRLEMWANMTDEERDEYVKRIYSDTDRGKKAGPKIKQKAIERFKDERWFNEVHLVSHRTPEYRAQQSVNTRAMFADPQKSAKYYETIASPQYKANLRAAMLKVNSDPEVQAKKSATLKQTLSSPEARLLKSERAKASTAKRLETRRKNAVQKETGQVPD